MATAKKNAKAGNDDKIEGMDFDPNLVLNLDDIDSSTTRREAIPRGIYDVEVMEAEFQKSKKDRPQVRWVLRTTHDDPDKDNAYVYYYTVLDSKVGQQRFKQAIEILMGEDELPDEFKVADVGDYVVGKTCRAAVSRGPNPNNPEQMTNSVDNLRPGRAASDGWMDD